LKGSRARKAVRNAFVPPKSVADNLNCAVFDRTDALRVPAHRPIWRLGRRRIATFGIKASSIRLPISTLFRRQRATSSARSRTRTALSAPRFRILLLWLDVKADDPNPRPKIMSAATIRATACPVGGRGRRTSRRDPDLPSIGVHAPGFYRLRTSSPSATRAHHRG